MLSLPGKPRTEKKHRVSPLPPWMRFLRYLAIVVLLSACSTADPVKSDGELGFTNAVVYTASTTNKTYTVKVGGEGDGGRYCRFEGDVPEKLNGWTYVISRHDADDFLIARDQLVKEKAVDEESETGSEE